jgi:hypothetical protein
MEWGAEIRGCGANCAWQRSASASGAVGVVAARVLGEKWPKGLVMSPKSAGLDTVLMGWTVVGAGPVSFFLIFQEFSNLQILPHL